MPAVTTPQEIETRLKTMIVERLFLKVPPAELGSEDSLIGDHGVDSVCLLELVVGLEDEFGIRLEDGDFDVRNFESVAALRDFVVRRLPA